MSKYELISEIKINDDIPVKKYILPDSQIKVFIAQVSSPLTNCYLSLGKLKNDNLLKFIAIPFN